MTTVAGKPGITHFYIIELVELRLQINFPRMFSYDNSNWFKGDIPVKFDADKSGTRNL